MEEYIGINIGALLTKFSVCEPLSKKQIYNSKDFKLKLELNDIIDRILPSMIQYKENNITLIGRSTKLGYKKYYLSTFENLSRFIGLGNKCGIFEEEKKYFLTLNNFNDGVFNFNLNNQEYTYPVDNIVYEFIKQIDIKIKKKLNENKLNKYFFSIPDYYIIFQKQSLNNILKNLCDKIDFPLINESTALTMYYGYFNYDELSEEKTYIIFIDIGHSKTSFILSEFTKKEFVVKEVKNIPFLGGRDFNYRIFELCLKKFEEENKRKLVITERNKIRLMEEIENKRKILSANEDININIEGIERGIDFSYTIKRSEFEEIISKELNIFEIEFKSFYNNIKSKYKISKIEMAGQLMRTPKLKSIVYEISNIILSETISLDMCHSLGVLLYGIFILENRHYEELKSVKSYNNYSLYYSFDKKNKIELVKKGENFPIEKTIKINKDDYQKYEKIYLFYDNNELKDLNININGEFDSKNIKKYVKNEDQNFYLNYKINESNEFEFI